MLRHVAKEFVQLASQRGLDYEPQAVVDLVGQGAGRNRSGADERVQRRALPVVPLGGDSSRSSVAGDELRRWWCWTVIGHGRCCARRARGGLVLVLARSLQAVLSGRGLRPSRARCAWLRTGSESAGLHQAHALAGHWPVVMLLARRNRWTAAGGRGVGTIAPRSLLTTSSTRRCTSSGSWHVECVAPFWS